MNILVTGGAGYIGSHTCLTLLEKGFDIVVVDNLSNSRFEPLKRVQELTGKSLSFHQVDICNKPDLKSVFDQYDFDAVIHFAGLKAVGESCEKPLSYYRNNIDGSLTLFELMKEHDVQDIVFSSSATVYGDPVQIPIREDCPVSPTNPYGNTKLMIETILRDQYQADPQWNIAILRYFNPVGAHASGLIGEDPADIPNNLLPYISQVAVGKLDHLSVFGNDYNTPDGTGVRDYIHVMDLAEGHISALEKLQTKPGIVTYNLGTGRGYSVLEMIAAFEKASGKKIEYRVSRRRPGDIARCYADPSLAAEELDWRARNGIDRMCSDAWRWQSNNPEGYS